MEGYARHSRSHFKPAPVPPSSAGAGAAYYKKGYTNAAAAAGGNGFMAYDDVFGGPPKFGATPFAPCAEDYSEIFGSFRSSRSSSIPMLDLPPVDDSVAAFEVLGCGGLEYSDIFGGFDFADFAASYDELFRRSDGSEESSDEAWTPVGTESPSGESDPYASSGRNQYFLNGDFHETLEDKVFDLSYDSAKLGNAEDSEPTHEAQFGSVPEYTCAFNGSTMRKEDEERYSSGVADDIILCEDSSGNISVETPWKTTSSKSHNCVVKESHAYDEKAGEAHGIGLSPKFVSFNDVSLRAEPSHLSPASGLPPNTVDRKKNPAFGSPPAKSNTTETIFGDGLFDFFDVEMNGDAGSSSIASVEAIKEAMDKAKLKINSAKESMKRKKDGTKDMPFMNNELNTDGKVRIVFEESVWRDDELQPTHEREFHAVKTSGDNLQFVSEASRVLPDPLQPKDADSTVAEPVQNQSSSLDPGLTEEDGEWKVTAECYELVNNGNSRPDPSLPDNIKNPGQEMSNCHFGIENGKTMHAQKLEQNVEGIVPTVNEDKDSESTDEACNPRENRRKLRASKPASRNAFHQKMVKLAQDVHETVIGGHVETVKKGKEGLEGDGVNWEKNERQFDQAALHKEESYFAGSEISSEEDFSEADFSNKGKEDCRLKENERKEAEAEVAAREETLKRVVDLTEREDNWRGLDDAHQNEEKEACIRKEAEAMTKILSPRDENSSVLNEALEKQDSDGRPKKADEESNVRESIIREKEAQKTHQGEGNAAMLKCYEKKLKESLDAKNLEHDVAAERISEESIDAADYHPTMHKRSESSDGTCKNEDEVDNYATEETLQTSEVEKSQMIYECSAMNEEQKMENGGDLQAEIKVTDLDNNQERKLHIESGDFISVGPSTLNEVEPEMACEHEELESSKLPSSPDDEDIISFDLARESEEHLENNVTEDMPIGEEKAEFRSETLYDQLESKVPHTAGRSTVSGRNESTQKQYLSSNINENIGEEATAANGSLVAEDREIAEKLKRKEESERERLRQLQLEKERERERELEKERLRKLEEEREKEREIELEKLRVRRVKEMREREREKELEKEHLRKMEEERQREREKDLEKARLRKLEEEWEREREREKDRMGVELKMSADRERAAVERATAEARQRAMAEARERLEKACAEAREKNSLGKASKEAQLRAERAAVERATAEARERAMEKAMAEKGVERSVSEKFSSSFRHVELRHCQSSNDLWNSYKSDGIEGESAQRCRARLERHRRTVERVAKALAEKNMRDLIAQREQAERNRFAETLDADIKRWSSGKERNLRALLSTLQYILGSDSGWQPIPLTEVITSAAVKKAYRKATLCVHPDKLQQRGATIQQKYICEKVFDLLKDAWNRFNSEER